jgi:transcriptional regulator with XRE-family HTH domain
MEAIELKIKRLRSGLKQYELAAKLGISPTQLCEIELGRRKPSPELLQHILEIIGGMNNAQ